ncbi:MAG: DsbA family protein [Patescibacteria group bacterium]|nr:DsbA family protein [Patescibacteria group bacterium]
MEKLTKKEKKELKKLDWQEKLKKEKRNQLVKKVAIWAGVAVVLVAAVYGLLQIANSPQESSTTAKIPPVTKTDIGRGNPNAKVTLVEYSDFQCPACAAYHPLVSQLLAELNGKIYFVYRFFPLIQIHQNAMNSAQAAYAAGQQGKFWEMHDLLFETQTSWADSQKAREVFTDYAKKLKLDMDKFKADFDSEKGKSLINDEYSKGLGIGINSTPTFFVNGEKIQNPRTYGDFKSLISNEINKK